MREKVVFFVIVLIFACFGQFATDIYTPSVPAVAHYFNVPMSLSQWTLVTYMVGIVIGLLFYGPISEGVGRRSPLIVGLLIALVGCVLCVFASTIYQLLMGRFILGLGAAAGLSSWRSIFRDTFSGVELAKYGSYLGVIIVFIIPLAPIIGGYLQEYVNWQANFIFLLSYGFIALMAVLLFFKETHISRHTDKLKVAFIKNAYKELLSSRIFLGGIICVFICYGAFFSWFTVSPVLLIHELKFTPTQFGWLSFVIGVVTTAGAGFMNGKLVLRLGVTSLLRFAFVTMTLSGFAMLIGSYLFGLNFYALVIPAFFFFFGIMFVWPNLFATVFTPFGHIAGYASSLYALLQYGGAAALGGVASHLPTVNQRPLAIMMMLSGILACVTYEALVRKEIAKHL